MIKRLTGEFLGTFSLVFCGTGAIIIDQETGGTITHAGIALTFGMIVLAMILAFGMCPAHISTPLFLSAFGWPGDFRVGMLFRSSLCK
jgi:aquaporin NIP